MFLVKFIDGPIWLPNSSINISQITFLDVAGPVLRKEIKMKREIQGSYWLGKNILADDTVI